MDSIAFDGPISQTLERLHISNGNLTEVNVEFLQVRIVLSRKLIHFFSSLNYIFIILKTKSLRKLKLLDLHGNQIKELKKNQFKNLRDLESLDISHNELTKLDSSHISDLTKLSFCNVSYNAIPEIAR